MANVLTVRLRETRRRIRRLTLAHGLLWLFAMLGGLLLAVGLTDWLMHASSGLRLLFGLTVTAATTFLLVRYLIQPFQEPIRDLDLALRLERAHPELGEELSSSLEFLDAKADDPYAGSKALRDRVVQSALNRAEHISIDGVIIAQPLRNAALCAVAAAAALAVVVVTHPADAALALVRLANPFGDHPWPKQTHLELVETRDRVAKGDPFTVAVRAEGVNPERVQLRYHFADGANTTPEDMRQESEGLFRSTLEAATRSFEFAIVGGDDELDWRHVDVVPAPEESELQLKVDFPSYTRLPPEIYPEGRGHVRAVVGSQVHLSAASNKPLHGAELRWEVGALVPALIAEDKLHLSAAFPVIQDDQYRLILRDAEEMTNAERSPKLYRVQAIPDAPPDVQLERPSGDQDVAEKADVPIRALLKDDFGLASAELVYSISAPGQGNVVEPARAGDEQRISLFKADDNPKRHLLEKVWSLAPLPLKPGCVLAFRIEAKDHRDKPAPNIGKSREIHLRVVTRDDFLAGMEGQQQRVREELQRISTLQTNAHKQVSDLERQAANTGALRQEDRETLAATETTQRQITSKVADPDQGLRKQVEELLANLKNNKITDVQSTRRLELVRAELGRVSEQHLPPISQSLAQARKEGESAGEAVRGKPESPKPPQGENNAGGGQQTPGKGATKNQPADAGKGNTSAKSGKQGGEAEGKSAKQPPAAEQPDGADDGASPQAGGKESPSAGKKSGAKKSSAGGKSGKGSAKQASGKPQEQSGKQSPAGEKPDAGENGAAKPQPQSAEQPTTGQANAKKQPGPAEPLNNAKEHQQKVLASLDQMLAQLDEWDTVSQAVNDARTLQRQQAEVANRLADVAPKVEGKEKDKLEPDEKASIEKTADRQETVRASVSKLENTIEKLARRAAKEDPLTAETLQDALSKSRSGNVAGKMTAAAKMIRENQLNDAAAAQKDIAKAVADVIDALENRRELELTRLVKKMREAEKAGRELAAEQKLLRKETKQAEAVKDPAQREDQLRQLQKRQQELERKAEDFARQLAKVQAQKAGRRAGRAAARMGQAGQRMQQGQNQEAGEQQEQALEELKQAQEELAQEAAKKEEQLAQEQMAKISDGLRLLYERQVGVRDEVNRLEAARKAAGRLSRGQMQSVLSLSLAQRGLGDEAKSLSVKLTAAKVFVVVLEQAVERMNAAAEKLSTRETGAPAQTAVNAAVRRLAQLLDSLKPDAGEEGEDKQAGGDGQGGGGGGGGGGGDGIPSIAQIKVLIALQSELQELTHSLIDAKQKAGRWSPEQEKEFTELSQRQGRLADLVRDLSEPAKDAEPEPAQDKGGAR